MGAISAAASAKGRIVCFGELLLRLSPPDRELPFQSPRLDARFGGAEANVAASLSILGHASAMVSALPDNTPGRACAGALERIRLSTSSPENWNAPRRLRSVPMLSSGRSFCICSHTVSSASSRSSACCEK
jgi:sugar/nucleoside kinase (ribokinase family)